uniref:Uncharacterized protein n=1 Tax=Vespula pensylvanica TaxID=30213 RepID=A0A834JRL8_VESPE|nr:hypothetical protein H0235_017320 [Vespula pensylvanica]
MNMEESASIMPLSCFAIVFKQRRGVGKDGARFVVITGLARRGRGRSGDAGDGARGGFLRARRVKPLLTITAGRVGRLRSCQASIIATNGSTLLPITSGHTLPAGNLDGVTPIWCGLSSDLHE